VPHFVVFDNPVVAAGELDAEKRAGAPGPPAQALWTALSRVVLNLDEAITKN
jgi:hypothetical protein